LTTPTSLLAAEAPNQAHSAELRKELGISDLILAQILAVVVPDFFGTAVLAGSAHVALWLVAILLFFIPQALVVAHLNRLIPLEGGLYEWARLAFNDGIGFLVAWNIWLFGTLYAAVIGFVATTYLAYVLGPRAAWMVSSPWAILCASAVFFAMLVLLACVGLRFGKWVSNAGCVVVLVTLGVLILMPIVGFRKGTLNDYHPLQFVVPPLTFFSLSVFSKMTFGALTSLEYVAIFAGETRDPARNYRRSIAVTAPIIALLYIFGTSAILCFVSPDSLDVIGPIPQALSRGSVSLGFAGIVAPVAILLLLANYFSSFCLNFTANSRLPMVAGWDRLLPEWFTRIHPRYKTPVNSIVFIGAVAMAAVIIALIGVGAQEAYELLLTWSFAFYGLAYLAMFAIPLLGRRDRGLRPKLWLRLAAVSGFLVTLVFVLLSVFPVIEVRNKGIYSLKTAVIIVGTNALGFLVYRLGQRRSRASANTVATDSGVL